MCRFPRHAFRDAVANAEEPGRFCWSGITEESKRFFTVGILFWGPTLILGIVLLVRLNQSLTWIPGTCAVRNVTEPVCLAENQTLCNVRSLYTASWSVAFCASSGCSAGPSPAIIAFNDSGLQNTRTALGFHPINSTDSCYLDPVERSMAVWAEQIDSIFSWAFPLFLFFLMFTVTLASPCAYRCFVAFRLYRHYKIHGIPSSPPQRQNSMEPLERVAAFRSRTGYSPRERASSLSNSDGLVIPDVRKLDLEASVAADEEDESVCKICYAHRINCRLGPCGHSFTCLECGKYFVGRTCGLCRLQVDSVKRIRKKRPSAPPKNSPRNAIEGDLAPVKKQRKNKRPRKQHPRDLSPEEKPT
eukprot:TRINITY_DN9859_c0_g1_i1.p1 TRINITY_DN9859_c0_g1~~TRINITY_DN9859_c0_g1_i1.p1  ORF type:complete len:359 (-),score=20.92 TRINITY_DN9859_c0_g1_i1:415-1491(-)